MTLREVNRVGEGQKNVPKLRFKGYEDAWEQRKVSEITKFHKQGYYTTEEYNDNKKYYLLRGTDLTGNKLVLKDTPKIDATEKDYDAFKTEIGDFLIVRSGNVGTYGIVDIDIPAIFGSYLIDFRFDTEKVTNEFFGYFYQSERFQSQLNKITQSSANININAENIKSTYISLPVLTEQKKISNIMSVVDNCITLHQRKYDALKSMKKTLLSKMFPKNGEAVPEIRFKEFTDAWEQRKLGEVAPVRGGFAFKSELFRVEGVPIVRISNIMSNGTVGGDFVFYDEQTPEENILLQNGSIVIAMSGATTGKVAQLSLESDKKLYQNQRVGYFLPTNAVDYNFIFSLVNSNSFKTQLNGIIIAGAQPNISSKDIDTFTFSFPALVKEQGSIGLFLIEVDNLITLHQRKLEELKKMKKTLLQQMFV